jgi:hypothetical protein
VGTGPGQEPYLQLSHTEQAEPGQALLATRPGDSGVGSVQRIRNLLSSLNDKLETAEASIRRKEKDMADLQQELKPFAHTGRLLSMREKLRGINEELGIGQDENVGGEEALDPELTKAIRLYLTKGLRSSRSARDYRPTLSRRLKQIHFRFFTRSARAREIPMSRLIASRHEPEAASRAERWMLAAYRGQAAKRKPITVTPSGPGRYRVLDGNATYLAARRHGWTSLPCTVAYPRQALKAVVRYSTSETQMTINRHQARDHVPVIRHIAARQGGRETIEKPIGMRRLQSLFKLERYPEVAGDGYAYFVLFAEGMAYQAFRRKRDALRFAARQPESELSSFRYRRVRKGERIQKAIAFSRDEVRASRGQATYQARPSRVSLLLTRRGLQDRRRNAVPFAARGVHRAASGLGMNRVTTHVTERLGTGPHPAQRNAVHTTYHHIYEHANPHEAGLFLRARLGGTHRFGTPTKTRIAGPNGIQDAVTFHAVDRRNRQEHRVTILHPPGQSGPASRIRDNRVQSSGFRVQAEHLTPNTGRTQGSPQRRTVKTPKPKAHSFAGALGAHHMGTQVQRGKRNAQGQPTDRNYSHFFQHKNPQNRALLLHAALSGTHQVSRIQVRRGNVGGKIRHQYSFTATPLSGGPSHTVAVMRAGF